MVWIILAFIVTIFALVFALIYIRFKNETCEARAQLLAGSLVVETKSGPIEYAIFGEGFPVMISHGGAGGYDQGLIIAQTYLDKDFKAIAVSRFGHLQTPLAKDSSAPAQADAYADLLDALNIPKCHYRIFWWRAVDNVNVPFSHAQHLYKSIPNAQLLSLPDGGHLKLGHFEEFRSETIHFLNQNN